MLVWKKIIMVYKEPLHGPIFLGKGGENGSVLVLKMGCDIEN
jgi:hypothetical protein